MGCSRLQPRFKLAAFSCGDRCRRHADNRRFPVTVMMHGFWRLAGRCCWRSSPQVSESRPMKGWVSEMRRQCRRPFSISERKSPCVSCISGEAREFFSRLANAHLDALRRVRRNRPLDRGRSTAPRSPGPFSRDAAPRSFRSCNESPASTPRTFPLSTVRHCGQRCPACGAWSSLRAPTR